MGVGLQYRHRLTSFYVCGTVMWMELQWLIPHLRCFLPVSVDLSVHWLVIISMMVSWNSILVEKYNRRRSWLCDAPVTIEYDSSSIELCTITNVVMRMIEEDQGFVMQQPIGNMTTVLVEQRYSHISKHHISFTYKRCFVQTVDKRAKDTSSIFRTSGVETH